MGLGYGRRGFCIIVVLVRGICVQLCSFIVLVVVEKEISELFFISL